MKYDYIIYHKNCVDGFSSYVTCHLFNVVSNDAITYPAQPFDTIPPPNVEDKNVLIMDVAFKKSIIEDILSKAKHVTFIDHHVSIHKDVQNIIKELKKTEDKSKFIYIYDIDKCGSILTWEYLNKLTKKGFNKIPRFILYIKDHDIGLWEMKYTKAFIAGLYVLYPMAPTHENIKKWLKLADKDVVTQVIKKGMIYLEYDNYLVTQNVNAYSIELFPGDKVYKNNTDIFSSLNIKHGQYKVAVYNGGCPNATPVSDAILNKLSDIDFVIFWTYNLEKKKYIVTFRSRNIDISVFAQLFHGGGHKLAASGWFLSDEYQINDLFMPEGVPRN